MRKCTLLFLMVIAATLCANVAHAQSGIITTIAGSDSAGYRGDGGAATAAQLNEPIGIALDSVGNIYIADELNNVIRKVNTAGIISTIAGSGYGAGLGYGDYSGDGGAATKGTLNTPLDVAVDRAGNIYIADAGNNVIRKVNTAGIISTIAGSGYGAGLGYGGYSGDGVPATAGQLDWPTGVAVDSVGNIYIADELNNVIRKVNTSGIITTIAGNGYDAGSGFGGYSGDGGAATAAELNEPASVAFDNVGNIYISDWSNNVIRKVNTFGIISTVAGNDSLGAGYSGDSGAATGAQLDMPSGIMIDSTGNIYIADCYNNVIRKVNTSGIISTIAGNYKLGYGFSGDGSAATTAQLYYPTDVALDGAGNIYISDWLNNRIRKVTFPTASLTAYPNTVCQDSCITFINTSTIAFDSIRWFINGLPISEPDSDTVNVCFPLAGNDTVKLYVFDSGKVDSVTRVVTIKARPHPVIDTGMYVLCCRVPDVYFSYQWYELGGTLIPGATNNSFMAGLGGFVVEVDSGGCLGFSDTGWIYEGVNNINAPNGNISLHPNPATTALSIASTNIITHITITNILGQTVFTHEYNPNQRSGQAQVEVDVGDLAGGVYFVKVNGVEVRKFIKE